VRGSSRSASTGVHGNANLVRHPYDILVDLERRGVVLASRNYEVQESGGLDGGAMLPYAILGLNMTPAV
jgi:hypothetical protein